MKKDLPKQKRLGWSGIKRGTHFLRQNHRLKVIIISNFLLALDNYRNSNLKQIE